MTVNQLSMGMDLQKQIEIWNNANSFAINTQSRVKGNPGLYHPNELFVDFMAVKTMALQNITRRLEILNEQFAAI